VVFWQKFDPEQFDFEFDEEEFAGHDGGRRLKLIVYEKSKGLILVLTDWDT